MHAWKRSCSKVAGWMPRGIQEDGPSDLHTWVNRHTQPSLCWVEAISKGINPDPQTHCSSSPQKHGCLISQRLQHYPQSAKTCHPTPPPPFSQLTHSNPPCMQSSVLFIHSLSLLPPPSSSSSSLSSCLLVDCPSWVTDDSRTSHPDWSMTEALKQHLTG